MILRHVKLTLPSVCDGLPSSGIAGRLFFATSFLVRFLSILVLGVQCWVSSHCWYCREELPALYAGESLGKMAVTPSVKVKKSFL